MKTILCSILLASSAAAFAAGSHGSAASHRFVHHQWKLVDLMQDGRFRFQGSDNLTYYYTVSGSADDHFVSGPTTSADGIYFLPEGGQWSHSTLDETGNVAEEERTVIYFDDKGSPADGQHPPADENSGDTN
jgi:hypothetical protein